MNVLERLSVFTAGSLAHDREAVVGDGWRREGLHRERIARHSINQQSSVSGVLGEVGQVLGRQLAGVFAELLGKDLSVVAADLKTDDRTDVAEDSVRNFFVQWAAVSGSRFHISNREELRGRVYDFSELAD